MTAASRYALRSDPPDEALLFEAAPLPGDAFVLSWPDGTTSNLSGRQWTAEAPLDAGYALHVGREQARVLRAMCWYPAELQENVLIMAMAYAEHRHPGALFGWFMLGFTGAVS